MLTDENIMPIDPEEDLEQVRNLKPEDHAKLTETGELVVIKSIEDDGMTDNKIINVEFLDGDRAGTTGQMSENELELAA